MSDVASGPAWWMAQDGKWYPPELHPDVRSELSTTSQPSGAEGVTASGAKPEITAKAPSSRSARAVRFAAAPQSGQNEPARSTSPTPVVTATEVTDELDTPDTPQPEAVALPTPFVERRASRRHPDPTSPADQRRPASSEPAIEPTDTSDAADTGLTSSADASRPAIHGVQSSDHSTGFAPPTIKVKPTIVDLPPGNLHRSIIPGGYNHPVSFAVELPQDPSGFPIIPADPAVIQALSTAAGANVGEKPAEADESGNDREDLIAPIATWKNGMPVPKSDHRTYYPSPRFAKSRHLSADQRSGSPANQNHPDAAFHHNPYTVDRSGSPWASTRKKGRWPLGAKVAVLLVVASGLATGAYFVLHPPPTRSADAAGLAFAQDLDNQNWSGAAALTAPSEQVSTGEVLAQLTTQPLSNQTPVALSLGAALPSGDTTSGPVVIDQCNADFSCVSYLSLPMVKTGGKWYVDWDAWVVAGHGA